MIEIELVARFGFEVRASDSRVGSPIVYMTTHVGSAEDTAQSEAWPCVFITEHVTGVPLRVLESSFSMSPFSCAALVRERMTPTDIGGHRIEHDWTSEVVVG